MTQNTSSFRLSPRAPAVRFGPPVRGSRIDAPRGKYPLEWNREAELVTESDRYALTLVGGISSRTTSSYVTVYRASDGERIELPALIETFRKPSKKFPGGYWYFSCAGVGSWKHESSKAAFAQACEGLLMYVAQADASKGQVAA